MPLGFERTTNAHRSRLDLHYDHSDTKDYISLLIEVRLLSGVTRNVEQYEGDQVRLYIPDME
jgi:hypothetical protein